MKKWGIALVLLSIAGCNQGDQVLYQNEKFTLYPDRVEQGANVATVLSPQKIHSNYRSLASQMYPRKLEFKFSLNEKDNEMRSGINHQVVIGGEHTSPVYTFGQAAEPAADAGEMLPINYSYTFRLDLRPVLQAFEKQGYYEAFDGTRIAQADFKSVCIAGGSAPMTWDFVNLEEKNLILHDEDGDGIYEITLVLNPYDEAAEAEKTWEASVDVSDKPQYHSNQPLVDALYNMSLEEARMAIEPDSTLRTGAKWGGVWTRDVSYSIFLAFAYHEPEVAKISLLCKVNKRKRIIQDTGSGGAWPVSSDRTTWALAAWELYKITGDKEWLQQAFEIIKNTLDDDALTLSSETGMYKGESSFLDWREQTYPKWMSNKDIYVSENLGTNVVHYQAHKILVDMGHILDQPVGIYEKRAETIKKGINDYLWMPDRAYYAQYLYGRSALMISPRFEALGEALAVLFDVADEEQAKQIVAKAPVTPYGTTCIYPQIPDIPPYHNNGIWPFVQSYWNLAAAKAGNAAVLQHGLASIYRAGAFFLTNYENFVADNGDYVGTEVNSHRMLWSMAGNLAMVHRVFMGMHFEADGLRFQPVVPEAYGGTRHLQNFPYRKAVLDITVKGYGNKIDKITLDGEPLADGFLPASVVGKHTIEIVLANNKLSEEINFVANHHSLPNPQVRLDGSVLHWDEVPGAQSYRVYCDGIIAWQGMALQYETAGTEGEYMVTALDSAAYESFASEPILLHDVVQAKQLELEAFYKASSLPYTNYTGDGFIKISTEEHTKISLAVAVEQAGFYELYFRYANGTGPWNTDNNCAIRSLYVNDNYSGVQIFPQRGTDEWSDWGFSNALKVHLNAGVNEVELVYEDWNTNMDGEINEALLDYLRVIPVRGLD